VRENVTVRYRAPRSTMSRRGFVLGLLGVAAFGLTLPLTRVAVLATSALDVFALRLLLAALAAAAVIVLRGVPPPAREHRFPLVLVAAGVVVGFPLFTSLAMDSAPAAHGGVVLGILPLATAVAGVLLYRERPSVAFWLTAAAGSALALAFALGGKGAGGGLGIGDLWLALAVPSAALGYAVGGRLSSRMPAWQVISWALVGSLPVALALPALLGTPLTGLLVGPQRVSLSVLSAILYLGLVSQYGGFLLWYRALALDGVARTSQIQLVQPFFTLAGAALLLGERIDGRTIAFALAILATVLLSRRTKVHREPEEASGGDEGAAPPSRP